MEKKTIWIIILSIILIVGIIVVLWLIYGGKTEEETEATVSPSQGEGYINVGTEAAHNLIEENPDIIIIDVSSKYDEGHIPEALNYYVGDGSLDVAIPDLDKNVPYLVYCHFDNAAIEGAEKLVNAGVKKVYRLEGNFGAWEGGGYPVEIPLNAVGSFEGSGKSIRSYLGNEFYNRVEAEISDPEAGKFYEGWLVNEGGDFFSTGKMTKENGKYVLEYSASEDQYSYYKVVVTQESESLGLDGVPETHVLEGEFNQVEIPS